MVRKYPNIIAPMMIINIMPVVSTVAIAAPEISFRLILRINREMTRAANAPKAAASVTVAIPE